MSNVLKPEKQEQVRALGRLGWSLRRIEEETGVRRETISRYLKQAGIAVRGARCRRLEGDPDQAKAASLPTADPGGGAEATSPPSAELERGSYSARASACEPFRDWIEEQLNRGRPVVAVWQDLVDDHGFTHSYECVKRFARRVVGQTRLAAHPRIHSEPGEEGQVDYGSGPMVRHPETGKYRRTRLFALTLGCSRKSVWLLTWKSSTKTWAELHEKALRRLGGSPRTIVLDNLREGVLNRPLKKSREAQSCGFGVPLASRTAGESLIRRGFATSMGRRRRCSEPARLLQRSVKPDIYDPAINPLFEAVLSHYGVVPLPAKVRDPNRKGKVESAIGYAERRLKGMRFESLEEAQAYLDRWSERWADTRIHGTVKRQVAAMFEEEKAALLPLPTAPFRYFEHGTRVVHLDGCVEVAASYYSVPPGRIHSQVHVRWDALYVRIFDPKTGQLLREHVRDHQRGRHRIDKKDESAKQPLPVRKLLLRANTAGPMTGKLCERIHAQRGQAGVRGILGVLSLVKKRGQEAVEEAANAALEMNAPSYRFVKRYLERVQPPAAPLKQVDALIRDLSHYRDFIEQKADPRT